MSSLKHSRSTPVPILLNEFPAPPTFIPHNISNPPPSRPPSLPLPPLPGPSPLSDHDLFQITAATRSRRASRISTSSNSSSWRDSSASFASVGSGPSSLALTASTAMTTQPSARNPTEPASSTSTHSLRSHSAYARAANADNLRPPPTMNPAIMEDDESLSVDPVDPSLTRTSLADIPRITSPNPYEPALHGERLSSIDMRDLPAMQDDDLDTQAHSFHMQTHTAQPTSRTPKSHQVMPQPQNGNPTGGETHRRASSAIQHSQNKGSFHDAGHASTAFPGRLLPDERDRASSPDIASIIAATPRPRRRSETSSGSRSRSHSRRRAPKSLPGSRRTSAAAAGRLSLFSLPDEHVRQGSISSASRSLLPYANNADDGDGLWNEDSLIDDYGVVVGGDDGAFANVPDEDDIAGESDSSLDLHTPLPSLMLRDGLLSPHSKLLPHNVGCDSPVVATHPNRHGSVVSNSMTKSGVFKDERDTIRRRVRHRDGRLLRGGIGLTTGLGWSDSEDEDAPSPLTKRLSHLALSRQSSTASFKTAPRPSRSHPHPLSRSFSADGKSKSIQNLRRPSLPPTSWQSRSRTVPSTLSLSIPEQDSPEPAPAPTRFSEPPASRVDIQVDSQRNDQVRTPSSSSTQSLLGPSTPDMMDVPPHSASIKSFDPDKSLPPLPLSRGPSIASLRPKGSLSDVKHRPPRLEMLPLRRPISSGSELSDSPVVSQHTPKLSHTHTSTRATPRPLQLSASLGSSLQPGEPASMQGLLLSYNRQLHDQQRARASSGPSPSASTSRYSVRSLTSPGVSKSGSMDFSLLELGEPRLRPRTGTGMVYKRSSTSFTRAAADVQAQSRIRMTSERTSQVAS